MRLPLGCEEERGSHQEGTGTNLFVDCSTGFSIGSSISRSSETPKVKKAGRNRPPKRFRRQQLRSSETPKVKKAGRNRPPKRFRRQQLRKFVITLWRCGTHKVEVANDL
ncbi:hypothetical protein DY000_02022585 [Brassica cretica]|uniref:Uncharacterized protein n=1 Tax=Brassica cretica TaxID=69181 RepID=A0ABQ7EBN8_BRACR|nr:hypothetical protein DY000_02022585 [Brassica cretica]